MTLERGREVRMDYIDEQELEPMDTITITVFIDEDGDLALSHEEMADQLAIVARRHGWTIEDPDWLQ